VLHNQGKYGEAEKLNRRALEGREKELGVQHPDTLTSVYCLAYLLYMTKRYAEAAELYQQAYEGYIQALGPQHPHTIACGQHFLALEREQKYAQLAEDQEIAMHSKAAVSDSSHAVDRENAIVSSSSRQKGKQGSFIARMKGRVRRREI